MSCGQKFSLVSNVSRIKESTRVAERALVGSISETIFSIMVAKAPFLAWPVMKTIVRWMMDHFLYFLSEQGIIYFNTVWIRVRINAESAALEKLRQQAIEMLEGGTVMNSELEKLDREMSNAFDDLNRIGRNPL